MPSRVSITTFALAALSQFVAAADPPSFEADVLPFIDAHCATCHDADTAKGDVDLDQLTESFDTLAAASLWQDVLGQLQAEVMPPLKAKSQPTPDERRRVVRWIEPRLLASEHGDAYRRKLALPRYGNFVDHDRLFDPDNDTPPYSPARLWRLSPHIFDAQRSVSRHVKGRQNPFTFSTPAGDIRDFAATSTAGASTVETIALNADAELEFLFAEGVKAAAEPPEKRRRPHPFAPFVKPGHTPTDEERQHPVVDTFRRLVSRDPTPAELEKYLGLLDKNIADTGDLPASLRTTLKAIYLSPEAIYRMEWGLGPEDEHGRRLLAPEEMAYALAYALYDQGPRGGDGAAIGRALEEGKLATPGDVAAVVETLTKHERYPSPRVLRFFHEFFGYTKAPDVFKDGTRTAAFDIHHDPRNLVREADNLLKLVLREDRDVFRELLTTDRALVYHDGHNDRVLENHRRHVEDLATWDQARVDRDIDKRKAGLLKKPKYKYNPHLAPPELKRIEALRKTMLAEKQAEYRHLLENGPAMRRVRPGERRYLHAYNLDPATWKWPHVQPIKLPADQRAGLLTHPAWLVAHSFNDGNDPVHRGIWVYTKLLAGPLGDVPPEVDARIPEDPHKTLRDRMEPLRGEDCWSCHRKINPLGEPFEMFDDFGRFRTDHVFDKDGVLVPHGHTRKKLDPSHTTRPVDASGSFDPVGIPGLSGDFDNAVEMLHAIADTDRARQSFIRHLFRYLMGRNETPADARTLVAADRAYVESGGSFKALLVSLLSSDSFLYRR